MRIVTLNKDKGDPEMEIFIGRIHDATYETELWDSNKISKRNFRGLIDEPESFKLQLDDKAKDMDSNYLTWEIDVYSADGRQNDRYYVTVSILQDNILSTNGFFEYSGPLIGAEPILDRCKFLVR